jgi:hypothetical protein
VLDGSGARDDEGTAFDRLSFLVACVPWFVRGNGNTLRQHAIFVGSMAVLTALATLAAPLYQRWYRPMRRPGSDERPEN